MCVAHVAPPARHQAFQDSRAVQTISATRAQSATPVTIVATNAAPMALHVARPHSAATERNAIHKEFVAPVEAREISAADLAMRANPAIPASPETEWDRRQRASHAEMQTNGAATAAHAVSAASATRPSIAAEHAEEQD
jgi:hypothetical protein